MLGNRKHSPLHVLESSRQPASYLGATSVECGVSLGWDTEHGRLEVVFSQGDSDAFASSWTEQLPGSRALIMFGPGFFPDGPELHVDDLALEERYELPWPKLSAILGQPLPYWPRELRKYEVMARWRPGGARETVAARTLVDIDPILRLAIAYEADTPAHRTLVNFAKFMQSAAAESARCDIDMVRKGTDASTVIFLAVPMQVPDVDLDDVDKATRREGWRQVAQSRSDLARAAVDAVMTWDSGKSEFPGATIAEISEDNAWGRAWASRLEPVAWSASFLQFPETCVGETFVDPKTDALASRDSSGTLRTLVPDHLPSFAHVREVIFTEPCQVWVRTDDNLLYLAPATPGTGLNWGYSGSGPLALAALLERLLTGGPVNAVDGMLAPPTSLIKVTQHPWRPGTVLTREYLQLAKRGEAALPDEAEKAP